MNKITFSFKLILEDNTVKDWTDVTEAERQKLIENAGGRGSASLSAYYTAHLEEFAKL